MLILARVALAAFLVLTFLVLTMISCKYIDPKGYWSQNSTFIVKFDTDNKRKCQTAPRQNYRLNR